MRLFSMTGQEEQQHSEFTVVFLGSTHKSVLFDKLCEAATSFERHVQYPDIFYLNIEGETVEFSDPGMARTGGRELALRNADLVVLYLSALCPNSLQEIRSLEDDLKRRNNMPVRVICDLDEISPDEDEDETSTGISSTSEGYESDPERHPIRRRPSMERVRKANEDGSITIQEAENWTSTLGTHSVFMSMTSSQFDEAANLLEDLLTAIKMSKNRRARSIVPHLIKRRSKSRDSPSKISEIKPEKASRTSTKSDKGSRRGSLTNSKDSKVCSIM